MIMSPIIESYKKEVIKWAAILTVIGGSGSIGFMGISAANKSIDMTDRWTGSEHTIFAAEQKLVDVKQDEKTKDVLQIAEATALEIAKNEEAVEQIPLIKKDIEHIKENFEQQKQVDINQSKILEGHSEQLNSIRTGQATIIQKLENL